MGVKLALTLSVEHRLRVSENRVMGKCLDLRGRRWRRLEKTARMRSAEHVARMREMRNAYGILVGKPEVKRPLGRPTLRWERNTRRDLRELGWEDLD
jgi:hypothetical protein